MTRRIGPSDTLTFRVPIPVAYVLALLYVCVVSRLWPRTIFSFIPVTRVAIMGASSSLAADRAATCKQKRAARDAKLAAFTPPTVAPELVQRILAASACELVDLMRARELTAVQVVGCYVERCFRIGVELSGSHCATTRRSLTFGLRRARPRVQQSRKRTSRWHLISRARVTRGVPPGRL